jgi:DnaJ family protein C protein 28
MTEQKSSTVVPHRRDWESWIDQQIREAQERGEFDDLPGKGRPLDLTPNPYAQDQELAFKILKDAGYAPEWIEMDKAIRQNYADLYRQQRRTRPDLGENMVFPPEGYPSS